MKNRIRRAVVAGLAVMPLTLTLGVAAAPDPAAEPAAGALPAPSSGFRVLPYLQAPGARTMTLSWVSELDEPGTVVVTGPGLRGPARLASEPERLDLMEYTQAELDQEIDGLEQGSWLWSDDSYKHSVGLDGLRPDHTYRYTVAQGDETFRGTFATAPTARRWDRLRLMAFSDTETEPMGAVEQREWELHPDGYTDGSVERPGPGSMWEQVHGSTTRYGEHTLRYPLDQRSALVENTEAIEAADPDLMLLAGDLVQGSGYQPAWDEFWRHFAGEYGTLASEVPLLTAIGNWETFGALNDGYGTPEDRSPAVIGRNRYHDYFDTPGDRDNPQYKDSYYRLDYGPVTLLTLDSTNGVPDENVDEGILTGEVFSGDDTNLTFDRRTTDTQGSFTASEYGAAFADVYPGLSPADTDLPNLNPGTEQWAWATEQLADARERGQIVLVQFHHAPYSSGVHGTPPNHVYADNQSGVAMRVYSPLFEEYGVAAVISGHDEMFERSWVDGDGDGVGFNVYDVGVAADGLRGEQLVESEGGELVPVGFNSRSQWSASADEPETWELDANGNPRLVDGGLHYGHLQMDLANTRCGAELTFSPVYLFPVLDDGYELVRTERRVYDDVVTVHLGDDGTPLAGPVKCRPDRG
ncbi:hypothetical protein GCM10009809_35210 [Isoptericola hypogeus]|uniref:Calcineurin-like phosphoesterase domain-containing protein n=1 Tax=Isoptericola hypogeus TaxID=300179 RepID=A0ABP4VSW6_9MICO